MSLHRPAAAPLPRYGLIDLSTGDISELPLGNSVDQLTLVDITSSGSDTFAIDLLGTFYRVDTSTGNHTRLGDLGGFLSGVVFNSLGFASSGMFRSPIRSNYPCCPIDNTSSLTLSINTST